MIDSKVRMDTLMHREKDSLLTQKYFYCLLIEETVRMGYLLMAFISS